MWRDGNYVRSIIWSGDLCHTGIRANLKYFVVKSKVKDKMVFLCTLLYAPRAGQQQNGVLFQPWQQKWTWQSQCRIFSCLNQRTDHPHAWSHGQYQKQNKTKPLSLPVLSLPSLASPLPSWKLSLPVTTSGDHFIWLNGRAGLGTWSQQRTLCPFGAPQLLSSETSSLMPNHRSGLNWN